MNVSRIFIIAMIALAPLRPPAQQESLASIRGVVINALSKLPVNGATVELTGVVGDRVMSYSGRTGADGTFELRDIQPARDYQLTASDTSNYQPGALGQLGPNDPWTPITLTAGQNVSSVRLVLKPLSSISGKILDGEGKPLFQTQVYLLRATYVEGRRELREVGFFQLTNKDGLYFFGGLGTGQYYLRTNPANSTSIRQLFESPALWDSKNQTSGEPEGFPTTYFPGTMDLAAATPINLLNGEKVQDINLRVMKVRTRRVSGTVLLETKGTAENPLASSINVLLVPRSAGAESSFTRSVTAKNGQFDFRGVLPGAYFLRAVVMDGKTQLTAMKPVDVADSNLEKLSIAVAAGIDIPGSIRFADWQGGIPPDYSQLAINLVPDNSAPIDRTFAGTRLTALPLIVAPTSNGQFVLKGVQTGDYRIRLLLNPRLTAGAVVPLDLKAAYLASLRVGNNDALDQGIHIDGNPGGNLDIVIATNSGSVFGRVLDDNHEPTVPARMVIVPDAAHRKRFDLFYQVPVSPTGRFNLDGIPPGHYKLFAWAHVEDGAWFDPEFLRVYEDRGTPIQIEESGSYPIEIPIIH